MTLYFLLNCKTLCNILLVFTSILYNEYWRYKLELYIFSRIKVIHVAFYIIMAVIGALAIYRIIFYIRISKGVENSKEIDEELLRLLNEEE